MLNKVEYLVVGASYAGSLLAAELAASGSTLLVDRAEPGSRMNCGGGVHAETFKRLEVDVPHIEARTILMSVLGRETSFPCRYVVVDRSELNKALFDKAEAAGVEFERATYLYRDDSAKTAFFRTSAGERLETRYGKIIFADGFHPAVRRIPSVEPAAELQRLTGAAKARIHEGVSRYGDALYFKITEENPFGYSWLFPMPDGRVNIGAGGFASTGVPEEWIDDLTGTENVSGAPLVKGGGVFPMTPLKRVRHGDAYLFGDAAGMVYALNGEGLKHIRDSLPLWKSAILAGIDLNSAWRRSPTYLKLAFASKALRGIRKFSRVFNRPLYPPICRLAAFSRRVVKM